LILAIVVGDLGLVDWLNGLLGIGYCLIEYWLNGVLGIG